MPEISWTANSSEVIYPVFVPFMGCRSRCIFCDQGVQTGFAADNAALEKQLFETIHRLYLRKERGLPPARLAFYGGTFTALPEQVWKRCIKYASKLKEDGLITGSSCSTRPDQLGAERLKELVSAGFDLVELGIQTLNEKALRESGRPYSLKECEFSVKTLDYWHMRAGIQLMPGFPFTEPAQFLRDLEICLKWGVRVFRFYPCVVFAKTPLAQLFIKKMYVPLSLNEALEFTAKGLEKILEFKASVIRCGILVDKNGQKRIIAGPFHESFGSMVQAQALFEILRAFVVQHDLLKNHKFIKLTLPFAVQGFFWGWKGSLKERWRTLGIIRENVHYWAKDKISMAGIN